MKAKKKEKKKKKNPNKQMAEDFSRSPVGQCEAWGPEEDRTHFPNCGGDRGPWGRLHAGGPVSGNVADGIHQAVGRPRYGSLVVIAGTGWETKCRIPKYQTEGHKSQDHRLLGAKG